jgi:hypothetical protein
VDSADSRGMYASGSMAWTDAFAMKNKTKDSDRAEWGNRMKGFFRI